MSKKKPYSKIVNAEAIRTLAFENRRKNRRFKRDNTPDWFVRLYNEADELQERTIKLADFLWVQETEDSTVRYSPVALAMPGKYRQLLVRQHKAMGALLDILEKRIRFEWPKTGRPVNK